MKKILLTGVSGYLGSNLLEKINKKNYLILGVDKKISNHRFKNYKFLKSDLRNLKLPNSFKPDVIIHLGSLNSEKFYRKETFNSYDIDINSTLKICKIASKYKVKNLIFASSEWVYGDNNRLKSLNEKININRNLLSSFYALSKIICEDLIKIFYKNKLISNYIILRLGIFYGERKKPNSAVEGIFKDIKEDKKVIVNSSLNSSRKFIHVEDVSDAIIKSINIKKPYTINIAGNRLVSLRQIMDYSSKIINKKYYAQSLNKKNFVSRNISNKISKNVLNWQPKIDLYNGLIRLKKYLNV